MEVMNKVVILAGGKGSRMGEVGDLIPKPMVKIGDLPIIEHIMNIFGNYEFIVAAGYKQESIREYFKNNNNVYVIDTGENTQTAGRILNLSSFIELNEPFYLCYGDGLTDFNPILLRNENNQAIVNMLAVHPSGRFGEIRFEGSIVTEFSEKPISDKWINGGYFFVKPEILHFIEKESDVLETDVFSKLVEERSLFCLPYEGYWHCMDTPKDWKELNDEYGNGNAKWLR
jgi:glucose-1-phosphate cytidylyltransferase